MRHFLVELGLEDELFLFFYGDVPRVAVLEPQLSFLIVILGIKSLEELPLLMCV